MELSFTKGAGKFDRMTVRRDGHEQTLDCPKQRIIPHDMVHYAVESLLHRRGFLSRVRDGEAADFRMAPEQESDSVERLVEVFQGDAWSGGDSAPEEMIALYQVTCRARECPPLAVTAEQILAIRARIVELDRLWQALPVGQSMTLEL
ncbi:hypothetical protein [Marilutibacter maris]|uniref:Uncharacterized protein n=1 Tax=Marilutibacter maris TaxID=1605891 RepID=A0A2U9T137_9GAMM|nr:hypothetical protein [Lysobacter maris]AWV06143.1 hypothetical protein C9I47_0419 [Lysobacter maris]